MQKNFTGAGLDSDARFAIADPRTQLVLSCASFHGYRNLRIDVAGTGARVEPEIRVRRDAKRHRA